MSVLTKIWNSLFYYRSNGWFNLPRTPASDPQPKHEGPFGAMAKKSAEWSDRVTYGGKHATVRFYVAVAVILTIITLIEVWLFNVKSLGAIFVPLLLILSAVKFLMVIAFFMHLRFDPKGFSWVFGSGMALGLAVFISVLALFFKLNG